MDISKREFTVLSIAVLFGIAAYMGTDIHLASLPFIAAYMHASQTQVQQSVPLYVIGMAFSLLFYGPISDRVGRRPVVIFALLFASLFCFVGALTRHIAAFLIMRVLQGVGCGACIGMGRAMVVDTIQGDRVASLGSYFSMFNSISPLLAPALGGYIQHYFNWQMNFIFLGVFLLIVMIVSLFFLPETNQHKNPHAIKLPVLLKTYASLLKYPIFIGCTLIAGFVIASGTTYNTISSYIFQKQYGLTPIAYGWVTALTIIGSVLGRAFVPSVVKQIQGARTMHMGILLFSFSGLLLLLFMFTGIISVALLVIGVVAMRFSQAFIFPITASYSLSEFHDRRGAASALYSSFQLFVAFFVASAAGASSYEGVALLGSTFLALGLLSLIIYFLFVKGTNK